MRTVNIHEAKSSLSRLIEAVETGAEDEVVIARNGRPVARLVAVLRPSAQHRIGVAHGRFKVPDSIDALNEEIERIFS